MEIQLGLLDAILDLLLVKPVFLLGIVWIAWMLMGIFRKDPGLPKARLTLCSLILYYYFCLVLTKIIGMPTLREFQRVSQLGESLFHPNLNLIPFRDGFSLSFLLNIFLFVPLGFLCPFLSRTFERPKNVFLLGLGVSLLIELIQLFTLYRATDIDDLITNVTGAVIGCLGFRVLGKLRIFPSNRRQNPEKHDGAAYLPAAILAAAFILGFFS